MAEGVTQVKQGTLAGLALIARNDSRLAATTNRNGVLARRSSRKYVLPVFLQPGEKSRVAEQSILGDLGVAGSEFALWQGVEQCGISNDQHRLVKGADQITAVPRLDACLAAARGIDFRENGRRHLHEIYAAPHARRSESSQVADDAAA